MSALSELQEEYEAVVRLGGEMAAAAGEWKRRAQHYEAMLRWIRDLVKEEPLYGTVPRYRRIVAVVDATLGEEAQP